MKTQATRGYDEDLAALLLVPRQEFLVRFMDFVAGLNPEQWQNFRQQSHVLATLENQVTRLLVAYRVRQQLSRAMTRFSAG